MKEYFDSAEYNRYFVMQQQALFFLMAYHAYIEMRSPLRSALMVLAFLWLADGFFNLNVVFTGFIGLVLALLTVFVEARKTCAPPLLSAYTQLYYYIVQPGILLYTLPLYVDQTEFPVGVFVAAVLWLGCNGFIWIMEGDARRWKSGRSVLLLFAPIFFIFLFSAVLSRMRWLPIIITVSVQLFFLAVNILLRFSSSSSS